MPSKLTSAAAALLVAAALAACGSSSGETTSATPAAATGPASSAQSTAAGATATTPATSAAASTTASTPASASTKPPASVHGKTVTVHVAGVGGKPATVTTVSDFTGVHRTSQRAHINGLSGLSVTQKMSVLLPSVAGMWKAYFQASGSQLPPANAVLVADGSSTCGSNTITSGSAPEYCTTNDTIELPLGTITSNIAPLGDSALLLLMSDLYGYHVENALGAFQKGYSNPQLEEMDSCFSGIYFYYAESEGYLQPADEQGVNNLLAAEAPASGNSSAGAVSASQLAQAFNKGILSNLNPKVCLP